MDNKIDIFRLSRPHPSDKDAILVLYVNHIALPKVLSSLSPSDLSKTKVEVIPLFVDFKISD